jgi:hypothetical protein
MQILDGAVPSKEHFDPILNSLEHGDDYRCAQSCLEKMSVLEIQLEERHLQAAVKSAINAKNVKVAEGILRSHSLQLMSFPKFGKIFCTSYLHIYHT